MREELKIPFLKYSIAKILLLVFISKSRFQICLKYFLKELFLSQ